MDNIDLGPYDPDVFVTFSDADRDQVPFEGLRLFRQAIFGVLPAYQQLANRLEFLTPIMRRAYSRLAFRYPYFQQQPVANWPVQYPAVPQGQPHFQDQRIPQQPFGNPVQPTGFLYPPTGHAQRTTGNQPPQQRITQPQPSGQDPLYVSPRPTGPLYVPSGPASTPRNVQPSSREQPLTPGGHKRITTPDPRDPPPRILQRPRKQPAPAPHTSPRVFINPDYSSLPVKAIQGKPKLPNNWDKLEACEQGDLTKLDYLRRHYFLGHYYRRPDYEERIRKLLRKYDAPPAANDGQDFQQDDFVYSDDEESPPEMMDEPAQAAANPADDPTEPITDVSAQLADINLDRIHSDAEDDEIQEEIERQTRGK